MGEQILIPMDGSECSKDGLEYGLERFPEADITVLHVRAIEDLGDIGLFSGLGGGSGESEELKEASEEILQEANEIAERHGRSIETDSVRGRPDRSIVQYADKNGSDLVIIGSHGRKGTERILLGSVAEKVVRRSPVPVLTVR
jgi:nucleotide-binding universal stress UspA family protein